MGWLAGQGITAGALNDTTIQVTTAAGLSSLTPLVQGMFAFVTDVGMMAVYNGSAWMYIATEVAMQTLSGTTASVTFSGLPPAGRLVLVWRARNTGASSGDLEMQIDGATTNYQSAKIQGRSATTTIITTATTYAPIGIIVGTTASYFSSGVATLDGWGTSTGFMSYSGTSAAFDTTSSYWTEIYNGQYLAAGPHSSIKLMPGVGSFAAGSVFSLYALN
jgi:hypothetical protein